MPTLFDTVVTSVKEALTVYSEKGRYMQMQNRRCYGLSFCKSGEIVYTHHGRETVSCPGYAVLLPMGGCYELRGSKTGEFPLINFYCDCDIHEFLRLPIRAIDPYLHDFERMKELLLLGRGKQKVMSLFYGILDRLAQEADAQKDVLSPVLRYLEEHYADPQLSGAVLAEQGQISEVYLRQLFRARFGVAPKQYVTELRMQKARQLLEEGSSAVGEVAAACGFTAVHHFCRTFKVLVGQTPTDYRRTHRKTVL